MTTDPQRPPDTLKLMIFRPQDGHVPPQEIPIQAGDELMAWAHWSREDGFSMDVLQLSYAELCALFTQRFAEKAEREAALKSQKETP
jgi:hypothetical protein